MGETSLEHAGRCHTARVLLRELVRCYQSRTRSYTKFSSESTALFLYLLLSRKKKVPTTASWAGDHLRDLSSSLTLHGRAFVAAGLLCICGRSRTGSANDLSEVKDSLSENFSARRVSSSSNSLGSTSSAPSVAKPRRETFKPQIRRSYLRHQPVAS